MGGQTALHATPSPHPPLTVGFWYQLVKPLYTPHPRRTPLKHGRLNPFTHNTLPTTPPPPPPPQNMGSQTALHITPSPSHTPKMGFGISQTNPFTHHPLPTPPATWAFDISWAHPFTHYTLLTTPHEKWAFGIGQSKPITLSKCQSFWKQFICPHIPVFFSF